MLNDGSVGSGSFGRGARCSVGSSSSPQSKDEAAEILTQDARGILQSCGGRNVSGPLFNPDECREQWNDFKREVSGRHVVAGDKELFARICALMTRSCSLI